MMLTALSSRLAIIPFCVLAALAAGCASSAPQLESVGYQSNGTYVLTAQEQGLGCRQLQERSLGLREQMQALSTRAVEQMQQVPNTVAAAWGRLFGSPGAGVPAVAEYNEARAESAALDAKLAQKGCAPVDTASIKR